MVKKFPYLLPWGWCEAEDFMEDTPDLTELEFEFLRCLNDRVTCSLQLCQSVYLLKLFFSFCVLWALSSSLSLAVDFSAKIKVRSNRSFVKKSEPIPGTSMTPTPTDPNLKPSMVVKEWLAIDRLRCGCYAATSVTHAFDASWQKNHFTSKAIFIFFLRGYAIIHRF